MRSRLTRSLATVLVTSATVLGATAAPAGAQALPFAMPVLPTPDQVLAQVRGMVPPELLAAGSSGAVAPAPAAAPAFADVSRPLQDAVLDRVNDWRRAHGLVTLTADPSLAGLAQGWADRLGASGQVVHNQDVLGRGMGENIVIAGTSCDAGCLVDLWKGSPGHNENLLDPGYRRAGVGIGRNHQGMLVIVQDYAY